MGFYHVISAGWDDLLVGYPIAAALGIAGAVVLSRPSGPSEAPTEPGEEIGRIDDEARRARSWR
jgi:hypothetical protein